MRRRRNHRTFPPTWFLHRLQLITIITIPFPFHWWRGWWWCGLKRYYQRHFEVSSRLWSSQPPRRRVVCTRRLFRRIERSQPVSAPSDSVSYLCRPPSPRPLSYSSITLRPRNGRRLWPAGWGRNVAEEDFPADDGGDSVELGVRRWGLGELGLEEGSVERVNWLIGNHGGRRRWRMEKDRWGFYIGK